MDRMEKLLALAKLSGQEGIIIHKPSNMFYLSGYTGEGIIAAGNGFKAIITDFRYTEQAERQAPGYDVMMIGGGASHGAMARSHAGLANQLFDEHGITCIRYEDDEVTVRAFESLKEALPGKEFVSLGNLPEEARKIKDDSEVNAIEEACDISCKAFEALLPRIKTGLTEKQLQIMLDYTMLEMGADGLAFDTIVASGENGSLPHAIPGSRKIQTGDMITFDFGAKKNGYCADMTRTVAVGQPKDEMKKIYDIVLQAQETCEALLAPGKCCKDIDAEARRIIDGAGYAGRFGHGLGHGVGIDIHELPSLSARCEEILVPGHIVTVEPGIYVPGLGGVRIENTCVITENGGRTLVHAQKALLIL